MEDSKAVQFKLEVHAIGKLFERGLWVLHNITYKSIAAVFSLALKSRLAAEYFLCRTDLTSETCFLYNYTQGKWKSLSVKKSSASQKCSYGHSFSLDMKALTLSWSFKRNLNS